MQVCPNLGYRVSLRDLLPDVEILGSDDIHVSGCTCDSRRIVPGDLFVAIDGSLHNGQEFIADAAINGAVAIVAEKPISGLATPVAVVPNVREAYGRICQALADHPSREIRVVGITGTNGKTTTSCLLAGILTAADYQPGLLGTLGYLDGKLIEDSQWTTPPADELATWLSRMVANGCSHAVMEVSSHALDQARVAGVEFDAACFTNITRDHLDYHRTLDHYRRAKAKLLDHLSGEGLAVINADDPVAAGLLSQIDGPVLTVAIDSPAEITAIPIEQFPNEQTFLLTAGTETIPVRTRMIGKHHIYNCLMASAVGLTYGIDLPTIARGLESAGHVPGRLERIECGQPFSVFVDYAHTPDALSCSLKTLREVTRGKLACVFGAGGNRDLHKRPLMGRAVAAIADRALITTDNPRMEDPSKIAEQVLSGFGKGSSVEVVLDRVEAIHRALRSAKPGDSVLIAGKGHEIEQIVGDERIPMDDGQIAADWLRDVQPYAETTADNPTTDN